MKKLLITGFDPFGGATENPSWLAVERLPEQGSPSMELEKITHALTVSIEAC